MKVKWSTDELSLRSRRSPHNDDDKGGLAMMMGEWASGE